MSSLAIADDRILPMTEAAINSVRRLEDVIEKDEQTQVDTSHIIHGGMYARTVLIPAGTVVAGAYIKLATLLIIDGTVTVFMGDKCADFQGYNVLAASAQRKQAFMAHTDTYLTMVFPSSARSVDEAENEFTDEPDRLMSRSNNNNRINITGE